MNGGGTGEPSATPISMTLREVVAFSVTAGLAAVFLDAALAHGLFWASDPSWTYWVIKLFLATSVFLLGTASYGVGLGPARALSAVHALVFTAYLQWLAPVGLPQEPEWLPVDRLWVVGAPIEFLATLGGYLMALWLWRRNRDGIPSRSGLQRNGPGIRNALFVATLIVVLDASLGQIVFRRDFPGITLLVQHLAIGFVFLSIWLTGVGHNRTGRMVGGVILALLWLTFDLYLGVEGLPSGTPVHPSFARLWWPSFPIALVAALLGLGTTGRVIPAQRGLALGGLALAMLFGATLQDSAGAGGNSAAPKPWIGGLPASAWASGEGYLVAGPDPSDSQTRYPISGSVDVDVIDSGTPDPEAPGSDSLDIRARFHASDDLYEVAIRKAMPRHPLGRYTTWSGVAYDREIHGNTGIGSTALPLMRPEIAVWGWAEVKRNGELLARMAPAHLMVSRSGPMPGIMLQVDTEGRGLLTEPDGHLTAVWPTVGAVTLPESRIRARHLAGCAALLALVVAFGLLAVYDRPSPSFAG